MKVRETGVLTSSDVYFHTPSAASKEIFLTLLCAGRYDCTPEYMVKRHSYESGLIPLVLEGSGYAEIGDRRHTLRQGDAVLLDCYLPHCYGTSSGWSILWVHFGGAAAHRMILSLEPSRRVLRPGAWSYEMRRCMMSVYGMFSDPGNAPDDVRIHTEITRMICFFFAGGQNESASAMDTVAAKLSDRLSERVTTRELAGMVHMSESQLNRSFRREKGLSPHQFRIEARLNAARYLLANTVLSLSEIALKCGFRDASALIHQFKARTGLTPGEYAAQCRDTIPDQLS